MSQDDDKKDYIFIKKRKIWQMCRDLQWAGPGFLFILRKKHGSL